MLDSLVRLAVCGLLAFRIVDARADLFDAPLPPDVFVTEAPASVPANQRAFAGKWSGVLVGQYGQREHTLVVERLEPRIAWLVWSSGLFRGTGGASGTAEWVRVPGRLAEDRLVAYLGSTTVTYRLESNDELSLESRQGSYVMKGTLKRIPMPAQPYKSEEPPTYWPLGIDRMEPRASTGAEKAAWPEGLDTDRAVGGAQGERQKWLGKWSGSACGGALCDVKLAVLSVTDQRARIIQLFASESAKPVATVRDAEFVGDELRLRVGGLRVAYRMRPTGVVEMFRVGGNGGFAWGTLTREP
ncbi:hypothetical protein DBA29_13270 [Xenophilus aerolatus]|nr:hypothetical protein [Xenophilus aerolatus]